MMSVQTRSDDASLPTIHFIEKPKEPVIETIAEENSEELNTINESEKPITSASHNRRVHFPIDDSQLRVFSQAEEPISRQPLVSLGMIIQRYRAACQNLQIRPLNALLDQLNNMDDGRKSFQDRLDCLKITNEKLDVKNVEAIEEILSRCRFHTLDFESTYIEDTAFGQLFDVIEYYESCTHLNLSNNRSIGFTGYQSLSKYFRRSYSLERLDMNSIRLDETNVLSLTRAVRLSTTLYELHVESCQLNGKVLQKFIQNLRSCTGLRELYLCDNRLQVQDSLLINELIRTCGQFLSLLDLRSNSLQDAGMSHLASQFSQYDEHHTSGNSLSKLSLQANQLTQQGVGFLAKSLLHNRTLHSLNLSHNNITNEGLFLLRDALLTNRTINELILRNCRLTDQSAIALAEFIAESTTIHYIDLRENNFQASGICGMAIAIKNNRSLLRLDFDPIAVTPTHLSAASSKNNIDRTTNTSSLLSLANLRRMTTSFSSFAGGATLNPSVSIGGGGTRELLEQKARWMHDIAAVCQRNALIYEEKLRLQEDQERNGTTQTEDQQQETKEVKPEDIHVEIPAAEINETMPNDQEQSTVTVSANGLAHSAETDNSTDENTINSDSNPTESTSSSAVATTETSDTNSQNGDKQDSTTDSPATNDELLRKIRHSDSIYLIRKKVKPTHDHSVFINDEDEDEDELSPISSADEQQPTSEETSTT